jgi:hypothetical protein
MYMKPAAAIAALALTGTGASAATFNLVGDGGVTGPGPGGNYCENFVSGTGDSVCNVNDSPWIVKYENTGDGWTIDEFNTAFGDASAFGGIRIEETDAGWTWSYDNDGDDPGITAFAAKGSNAHNLYVWDEPGGFFGGETISFLFPQGASNITFFDRADGDMNVIPLPAGVWLLLGGLGGLAAFRRRNRAA